MENLCLSAQQLLKSAGRKTKKTVNIDTFRKFLLNELAKDAQGGADD